MSQPSCSKTFFSAECDITTCPMTPAQLGIIANEIISTGQEVMTSDVKQSTADLQKKLLLAIAGSFSLLVLVLVLWVGASFVMIDHISVLSFGGIILLAFALIAGVLFGAKRYIDTTVEASYKTAVTTISKSFTDKFGTLQDLGDTNKAIGRIFDKYTKASPPCCPCSN